MGAIRCLFFAMIVAFPMGRIEGVSAAEPVYFVDAGAQHCLNCPDSRITEEVLAAVRHRGAVDMGAWLSESAAPTGPANAQEFRDSPITETYSQLISIWPHGGVVAFKIDRWRLDYWTTSCRVFDCYKYFMALHSSDDKVLWQRRVPHLKQPVYPLLTDWGIVFVGGKGGRSYLVVLDLESGVTRNEIRLPGEAVRFDATNPLDTFPFVTGRYVVVRGCSPERGSSGFVTERVPNGFLVIPIQIER